MDQTNTTRSILIVMIGVLVAGSSLTAIHTYLLIQQTEVISMTIITTTSAQPVNNNL